MNDLDRQRKTLLLTKAKDLLLKESDGIPCYGPDDDDVVNRFLSLYDRLCEELSNEKAGGNNKSIEMAPSRQWHNNEYNDDTTTTRQAVQVEWNLYRALRVTCTVLLDMMERIATTLVDDVNVSRLKAQRNLLRQTAFQCSYLTKILGETISCCCQGQGSSTGDQTLAQTRDMTDENDDNDGDDDSAQWERLVHRWTVERLAPPIRQDEAGVNCIGIEAENEDSDSDSGEDDMLMFTKEQLVEEERELLQMASIPIPILTTRPPTYNSNVTIAEEEEAEALTSLCLAEARLVMGESESCSSSSPLLTSMPIVTYDPHGILAVHSSPSAENRASVSPWYGLTSESDISFNSGTESNSGRVTTLMKITNVIAAEKHDGFAWSWTVVEAITMSVVGQDGLLQWWKVLSRLIVQLQGKSWEQQQGIARLWTPIQVAVAQAEAKQIRGIFSKQGRTTG